MATPPGLPFDLPPNARSARRFNFSTHAPKPRIQLNFGTCVPTPTLLGQKRFREGHGGSPDRKRRKVRSPSPEEVLALYYPDLAPKQWHENDQYLRNFDYAELRWGVKAFDIPRASLGNLDTVVHPLFAGLAVNEGLLPALRLTSCYLASPSLIAFWYALCFGDWQHLPELFQIFGGNVSEFRIQSHDLTPHQIERVQRMLLTASKGISISFQNESIDKVEVWGHTLRDFQKTPTGVVSHMYLDPEFLNCLGPNSPYTTEHRVRASFMLAHTLLHELAHALRNMRVPCPEGQQQSDFEPFFEDHREPEIGRALETFLWGGRISSFQGRIDGRYGLCFNKWPDLSPDKYVRSALTGEPIPLARRPQKKKWQTLYAIPHWWVQQQFSKAFWDGDVRLFGGSALYVPRILGFRSRNNEWFGGSEGIGSDDSSRGRHADEMRMVRPGQPTPPPTPPSTPPFENENEDEDEDEDDKM